MPGLAGWCGRGAQIPTIDSAIEHRLSASGMQPVAAYRNPGIALYRSPRSRDRDLGTTQPLQTDDGRFVICACGRLDNYRVLKTALEAEGVGFRTSSSWEVVLQGYRLHGEQMLEKLEGVFAFALHDVMKGEVLLARDPVGHEPLVIATHPFGVAFGSSPQLVLPQLPSEPTVSSVGVLQFLHLGHGIGPLSALEGIEELGAGEAVVLRDGIQAKRWRYAAAATPSKDAVPDSAGVIAQTLSTVMSEQLDGGSPVVLLNSDLEDAACLLGSLRGEGVERPQTVWLTTRCEKPLAPAHHHERSVRSLTDHFSGDLTCIAVDPADLVKHWVHTLWRLEELRFDETQLVMALAASTGLLPDGPVYCSPSGWSGLRLLATPHYFQTAKYRLLGFLGRSTSPVPFSSDFDLPDARRYLGDPPWMPGDSWRKTLNERWGEYPADWSIERRACALMIDYQLSPITGTDANRFGSAVGIKLATPFADRRWLAMLLSAYVPDSEYRRTSPVAQWAQGVICGWQVDQAASGAYQLGTHYLREERLSRLQRVLQSDPLISQWFRVHAIDRLIRRQVRRGDCVTPLMKLLHLVIWYRLFIVDGSREPPRAIDPIIYLEETMSAAR